MVIAMLRLLLLAIALVLASGCRDAAAPKLEKVHTGLCTVVYKYWFDRADHSKGFLTLTWRPPDTDSCPDEVIVVWDEDAPTP